MAFDPTDNTETKEDAGAAVPRRLYRKRQGSMLAGVAAGLADYFQLDVSLVRLLIILLTVLSAGAGIVGYILAWIIVPEEPDAPWAAASGQGRTFVGTVEAQSDTGNRGEAGAGNAGNVWRARDEESGGGELGGAEYQHQLFRRRQLLGWALVLIGLWALIDRVFPWFRWDLFWPVGLILVGLALVFHSSHGR
ncbi:MAG: PspC domain-containing protein [Limnochordales bacterium]|nr:PspC domain-containing protein [Limnochordales bacterium]